MPQAAMIVGGFALATVGVFTGNPALVTAGLGLIITGATYEEAGKPEQTGTDQTVTDTSPIAPRRIVFGDRPWGGSIAFMGSHGGNKQYLSYIIVLADEPVARIGEDYAGSEILDGVYVDRKKQRFIKNIRAEYPTGEFDSFDDYVPDPGDGRNEDFWLNTATNVLWTKSGRWKTIDETILSGTVNPTISVGNPNDYYRNTAANTLWHKNLRDYDSDQLINLTDWRQVANNGGTGGFDKLFTSTRSPHQPSVLRTRFDDGEQWLMRIDLRHGEVGEPNFDYIQANHPKWGNSQRLDGLPKAAITIFAHPKAFPHGRPEVLIRIRNGVNTVIDPRTAQSYSVNVTTNRITPASANPSDNAKVAFINGTPAGGLHEGRRYYVVGRDATSFQVSYLRGGTAIDLAGSASIGTTSLVTCNHTANIPLMAAHYMASPALHNMACRYGKDSGGPHHIDTERLITSANTADEFRTVPSYDEETWVGSRVYDYGVKVRNGTRIYEAIRTGTSAASGGPTGTGSSISDGGVTWRYLIDDGQERYWHGAGAIESIEDPNTVLSDMSLAMGGRVSHNGVVWKIAAGSGTSPSILDIGPERLILPIEVVPEADTNRRFNTILARWINPKKNWEIDELKEITNQEAIDQDNGEIYTTTVTCRFAASKFGARRQALVKLKEIRRQERVRFHTTLEAWEVEQFDAFRITHPTFGWFDRKFVLEEQEMAFRPPPGAASGLGDLRETTLSRPNEGLTVMMMGRDFDAEIYDESVDTIADDDDEIDLKDILDVKPPTNLTAALVATKRVMDDGSAAADAIFNWTPTNDPLVNKVELQWAEINSNGFAIEDWRCQVLAARKSHWRARNFEAGSFWRVRIRSLSWVPGVMSDEDDDKDWETQTEFSTARYGLLGAPPGALAKGENRIDNPNFEQEPRKTGEPPPGWRYEPGGNGSITYLSGTGVGRWGGGATRIVISTDTRRIRTRSTIPVETGERYVIRLWAKPTGITGTNVARILVNILKYDNDEVATGGASDTIVVEDFVVGQMGTFQRIAAQWTVPPGVSFMQIQVAAQRVGQAFTVDLDGFAARQVIGGTSDFLTSSQGVNLSPGGSGNGTNQVTIRKVVASSPGEPIDIAYAFDWKLGGWSPGSVITARCMVVRTNEAGGAETTIQPLFDIGEDYDPADPEKPGEQNNKWRSFQGSAVDKNKQRGTFIYYVKVTTSGINGKLDTRNRVMAWLLRSDTGQA